MFCRARSLRPGDLVRRLGSPLELPAVVPSALVGVACHRPAPRWLAYVPTWQTAAAAFGRGEYPVKVDPVRPRKCQRGDNGEGGMSSSAVTSNVSVWPRRNFPEIIGCRGATSRTSHQMTNGWPCSTLAPGVSLMPVAPSSRTFATMASRPFSTQGFQTISLSVHSLRSRGASSTRSARSVLTVEGRNRRPTSRTCLRCV